MPPGSNLGQLNTNEWERLQHCADRFEEACKGGQAVDMQQFLPPSGDPLRRKCLHELIKLDLELRWRRGDAINLAYYLEKYTELGPARSLPAALLFEEYLVRHRHGDKPALEAYKQRYPEQFEELALLVRERDMPTSAGSEATPANQRPPAPAPAPPPATPTAPPAGAGFGMLSPGTVLATGHTMIKRIGMGGFGEVWEALAPGGVRTAMKIILRPLDHESAKHELEALELIKNLRHHFLLSTHAFWALQDRLVIAMDLADGSLRDRLKQVSPKGGQGLPLPELMLYCRETAEALDYLHSKSVLHRDIKPENLLLAEGHIRVADFGLARLSKTMRSVTGSGSGTPLYMPPEFWREKVSLHSDQYSFAASYVELRLGRRMFPDHAFLALMNAHLEKTPDLNPLPEAEQQVLLKAMAKEADKRYPTCKAFVDALERAVRPELLGTETAPELETAPQGVPQQPSWNADTDWDTRMPGSEEGRGPRRRTGSGTQPLPKVWRGELPPWRPRVMVPLLLALVGLVVWLLVRSDVSEGASDIGPAVAVLGSPPPPLPVTGKAGPFRPVPAAGTKWVDGREYYQQVECEVGDGLRVTFRLIASKYKPDIQPFYMMQDKVWNGLYAVFVKSQPGAVQESYWRLGGRADRSQKAVRPEYQFAMIGVGEPPTSLTRLAYGLAWHWYEENNRIDLTDFLPHPEDLGVGDGKLPVLRVGVEDAQRFARWMGGLLPLEKEWDLAAGCWEKPRGDGPFQGSYNPVLLKEAEKAGKRLKEPLIAFKRTKEGPMPVGTAKDDVSYFQCHDMAGNGLEWTRSYTAGPVAATGELGSDEAPPSDAQFTLRGRSYRSQLPLLFQFLEVNHRKAQPLRASGTDWEHTYEIGFRVVVRPHEAPR